MDTTTVINGSEIARADMILVNRRWHLASPALSMINKRALRNLPVDRDKEASCSQGARLSVQTNLVQFEQIDVLEQIKPEITASSFVMGGFDAADGTYPTRWGSSPGSPPV